jgi:Ca2+-binding RTX toxin-like protein
LGTAGADILIGTAGNDIINGLAGADSISGNDGDDMIDGGPANDNLNGGTNTAFGDTVTYASATAAVTVSLATAAAQNTSGGGTDTLSNFENLTGSAFNDRLTGSATANRMEGGAGNDTLTGGAGTDTLDGGAGSDIYLVTVLGDKTAAEISDTGTSGVDELRFTGAANSTLTLFSGDIGLERVAIGTGTGATAVTTATTALNVDATAGANGLTIVGNAGANRLTGTAFADRIEGGTGNDALLGGVGSDTLVGGAGNDTLTGGEGADAFLFNFAPNATSNRDRIADFDTTQDLIWLSRAVMTGLGTTLGTLTEAAFRSGAGITTAGDATDRIIYNSTNGALYYDSDGTGRAAAIQLGDLSGLPTLTFDDFLIV